MKRKPYTQYSREFKAEAIRLAAAGDKPATQVARGLGIRVNQIGKWKKQLEREALTGATTKRGKRPDQACSNTLRCL